MDKFPKGLSKAVRFAKKAIRTYEEKQTGHLAMRLRESAQKVETAIARLRTFSVPDDRLRRFLTAHMKEETAERFLAGSD